MKLYEGCRAGRARFGWGWFDGADVRRLTTRNAEVGWQGLTPDEQAVLSHAGFLLRVAVDDYLVYINMPSYGECTAVRVLGPYDFSSLCDPNGEGDFRHLFSSEYV